MDILSDKKEYEYIKINPIFTKPQLIIKQLTQLQKNFYNIVKDLNKGKTNKSYHHK